MYQSIQKVLGVAAALLIQHTAYATVEKHTLDDLMRLKQAYPDWIQTVTKKTVTFKDGTVMPVSDGKKHKTEEEKLNNPSLGDQIIGVHYIAGIPENPRTYEPTGDPGRIRYEPFFKKMYGETEAAVRKHLVEIYWMPKVFGQQYPIRVTTVNGLDQKFKAISDDLEALVQLKPAYKVFLKNPGGTFKWRPIAKTNRLSMHSFGMTIDINTDKSHYWQWDLEQLGKMHYQNQIPYEIVDIFEKHGFIWGGKWKHYDTMHFEYRPEVFSTQPH